MVTIRQIREALAEAITDGTDNVVGYSHLTTAPEYPAAVVGMPEEIRFHADMSGAIAGEFPIYVLAMTGERDETEHVLEALTYGTDSLIAAIETAELPFAAQVQRARRYAAFDVNGREVLGFELLVAVAT